MSNGQYTDVEGVTNIELGDIETIGPEEHVRSLVIEKLAPPNIAVLLHSMDPEILAFGDQPSETKKDLAIQALKDLMSAKQNHASSAALGRTLISFPTGLLQTLNEKLEDLG